MKKIITLLITAAMLTSLCIMPVAAADKTTTTLVGLFDVDNNVKANETQGFDNGDDIYSTSKVGSYIGAFNLGTSDTYFLRVGRSNAAHVTTTVDGVKGTDNQSAKVTFIDDSQGSAKWSFMTLNSKMDTSLKTVNQTLTFRLKLPENIYFRLDVNEYSGTTNKGAYQLITSGSDDEYVKGVYYNEGISNSKYAYNVFKRNEWFEGKLIIDHTNGDFDFYINDRMLFEDMKLAYSDAFTALTLYVYEGSSGVDDSENNLYQVDESAYVDDVAFYAVADADIKVQPNVKKSGNGTVEVTADTVVKAGNPVTYTVTPDAGSYIEEVTLNGAPIATFEADEYVYQTTAAENQKLEVKFADYEEEMPSVAVSPFKVQTSEASYVFCRLFDNGVTPDEFGILLSTNEEPTSEEAVPFVEAETKNNKGVNEYGYFGYEIINQTDAAKYYVKPYAKKDDTYTYGDVETIDLTTVTTVTAE